MNIDQKKEALESIRLTMADIEESKRKVSAAKEMAQEKLEAMPYFDEVQTLTEKLAEAKAQLKSASMANGSYNDLLSEIADEQQKLKDLKQILSDHLVYYRDNFQEKQVEMNDDGDARELIITGKLGKEAKYQYNLFSQETE